MSVVIAVIKLSKQFYDIMISFFFISKAMKLGIIKYWWVTYIYRYLISSWGINFSKGTAWTLVPLLQLNERTERQRECRLWLHWCSAPGLMVWDCGSTFRFLNGKLSQVTNMCCAYYFLRLPETSPAIPILLWTIVTS